MSISVGYPQIETEARGWTIWILILFQYNVNKKWEIAKDRQFFKESEHK